MTADLIILHARPSRLKTAFLCLVLALQPALAAGGLFTRIGEFQIPIHAHESGRLVATVHGTGVQKTYQRKGFFRIGALPMWQVESVEVVVARPADTAGLLEALSAKTVRIEVTSRLEVGSLVVKVNGDSSARLTSGRCQQVAADCWRLEDVTLADDDGNVTRARRADLKFIQEHPGGPTVVIAGRALPLDSLLSSSAAFQTPNQENP